MCLPDPSPAGHRGKELGGDGGDHHDPAAAGHPHATCRQLAGQEGAAHVDGQQPVELDDGHVEEVGRSTDRSTADEHLRSFTCEHLVGLDEGRIDRGCIREIRRDRVKVLAA